MSIDDCVSINRRTYVDAAIRSIRSVSVFCSMDRGLLIFNELAPETVALCLEGLLNDN